ncbi:MAG: cytosine permease [Akkermansiaceae bacterium]
MPNVHIEEEAIEEVIGGEFEREPVPEKARKGPKAFWGMYAGEHAAGTEFMIGPLFLAAGASLKDLMFGLLIGNILAVLTWRYLVLPIAMKRRLTLYYQLEKIAGGNMVKLYNVTNGILFCFLAGAMITVSASAVGVPFDIRFEVPEATFGLSGAAFTMIVAVVGLVIAAIAAGGYRMVSHFSNIAAPWMILVFVACGVVSLAQMNVDSYAKLETIWNDGIAFVQIANGDVEFGFWKIVIFAWLCNAAMHFGMADLSIFRFTKSKSAGWAPAVGMFLGHYMAWICAALLLAALIATNSEATLNSAGKVQADPGFLAWNALGWTGIICVVIAGWTTANPTIYRAGLAFQSLFKNAPKATGVLIAGVVATIAGAFPNLSAQLLGFVGTYGMILGPMGAIIFINHYFAKRLGFHEDAADATGSGFNVAVLLAWLIPAIPGLWLILSKGVFAAYLVIPAWIASAILYVILGKIMFANKTQA